MHLYIIVIIYLIFFKPPTAFKYNPFSDAIFLQAFQPYPI